MNINNFLQERVDLGHWASTVRRPMGSPKTSGRTHTIEQVPKRCRNAAISSAPLNARTLVDWFESFHIAVRLLAIPRHWGLDV